MPEVKKEIPQIKKDVTDSPYYIMFPYKSFSDHQSIYALTPNARIKMRSVEDK